MVTVVAELARWQLSLLVRTRLVWQLCAGRVVGAGGGGRADAVAFTHWLISWRTAADVGTATRGRGAAEQTRVTATHIAVDTAERVDVKVHVLVTFTVKAAGEVDTQSDEATHVVAAALILIDTLAVFLHKSRRTFTAVTAVGVCALSLSTLGVFTLVYIYTLGASGVSPEASRTGALETTSGVLTCAVRAAQIPLLVAFIYVVTTVASLAESLLTLARETAWRVDTSAGAVVSHGGALIQVSTSESIHIEHIAWWTATDETSLSVGAGELAG